MKYREKHPKTSTCSFRVFYNKHMLDMDDLATLEGQNWLNDQVRYAWCLCASLPFFGQYVRLSVVHLLLRYKPTILNFTLQK